jgi:hypothetical protein
MLYRVRAAMTWPEGSGLPGWALAQMHVRHMQAVGINLGRANQETPVNRTSGRRWRCDLPLADSQAAFDAWETLRQPTVLGLCVWDDGPSWVDLHLCDHRNPQGGCVTVAYAEHPQPPDTTPPWVQPTGAHDAYPAGAQVTHNGRLWENVHGDGNVWEPGVYGWADLGPA